MRVFKKALYEQWYIKVFKKPLPQYTKGNWIDAYEGKTVYELLKVGLNPRDEWLVEEKNLTAGSLSRYLAEKIAESSNIEDVEEFQAEVERLVAIISKALDNIEGLIDEGIVEEAKKHLKEEEYIW